MGRYDILYYQCSNCDFVQTEPPYWLDEAYSEVINVSDIGLVRRNLKLAQLTQAVIDVFFNSGGKFVDYGGGYGLFVRLMRDRGMSFYRYDPFCENLFANSFDANINGEDKYELVTAFEVFEHLTDPLNEIEKILRISPNIIISTVLLPEDRPKPQEWWYYGLDHGQHVSIYSRRALEIIGERFGLRLYSNNYSFHLLTAKTISTGLFRLSINNRISIILNRLFRHQSLLPEDYYQITGHRLR
ncbi:MAG: class I SAM-dependent methyltransferase [Candidatus Promineifilaceae bacterium]|nr:class I SAM-dependent methyltransferase [Candidatus Promineifilaceae bacterium]